jgi:mercuric ion binding protein
MKVVVNGMVCSFCAQGIEKSISKMDGIKSIYIDLKGKVVVIEAKPGKALDEGSIVQEIKDSGYEVVKVEYIPQTVAEFKAGLKDKK